MRRPGNLMTVQHRLDHTSIVRPDGPLHASLGRQLRRRVHTLLCSGTQRLVLDLSRVTGIDAAGIGELIRAYNLTIEANSALRVTQVPARIRDLLVRVGLFDLLSDDRESLSEEGDALPATVRKS
jgi:anti-sigma B factor antagonist